MIFRVDVKGNRVAMTEEEEAAFLAEQQANAADPKQAQAAYVEAVQAHLDAHAREKGYDNIFTAVTYADEPAVAQFQTEGRAFRQWRSLVWGACYNILADVQAGRRALPTVEQLIAALPEGPAL